MICVVLCINILFFLLLSSITWKFYNPLPIYQLMKIGPFMNKAAMNLYIQVCQWTYVFFLLDNYPGVELLGCMISVNHIAFQSGCTILHSQVVYQVSS